MASHAKAHEMTDKLERGWVNHPNDKGGETWAGITRVHHATWKGWAIVDREKERLGIGAKTIKSPEIDKALDANLALRQMKIDLYKANYWDPLNLDDEPDQLLANKVYDICVNMGPKPSLAAMQGALEAQRQAADKHGLEPM